MNNSRRDLFKLVGVGAAAAALGTTATMAAPATKGVGKGTDKLLGKHQVLIIGGGWSGLTVAKELKKIDPAFDVAIIEKNSKFISCPMSNAKLGGVKGIDMAFLTHQYAPTKAKYKYGMLNAEVTSIDRVAKVVHTTKGAVGYDILVLAPGIEYNYKGQFPAWNDAKIAKARKLTPAALISTEHEGFDKIVKGMKGGDFVITVPAGKYRCPPAPFERATMIANLMKNKGIKGKVIILNETAEVAKGAAFKETWNDLYPEIVVYNANSVTKDIDFAKKTITYEETIFANKDDLEGVKTTKTIPYAVLNFIPHNMSHPTIALSGVETTKDGFKKVKMATSEAKPVSFQTASDASVYAVGDVVGHAIPPSGQAAIWSGKVVAKEIAHVLHGKSFSVASVLPFKSANVCFSMVNSNPEQGIMVNHEFMVQGPVIGSKASVPKGDTVNDKFRAASFGGATRDWYRGAMKDLFN